MLVDKNIEVPGLVWIFVLVFECFPILNIFYTWSIHIVLMTFWTSIDIMQCLDMAKLNINEKCVFIFYFLLYFYFLIQYMCISLFIVFTDFFPIQLKLFALLPRRFIADSESGNIDNYCQNIYICIVTLFLYKYHICTIFIYVI